MGDLKLSYFISIMFSICLCVCVHECANGEKKKESNDDEKPHETYTEKWARETNEKPIEKF